MLILFSLVCRNDCYDFVTWLYELEFFSFVDCLESYVLVTGLHINSADASNYVKLTNDNIVHCARKNAYFWSEPRDFLSDLTSRGNANDIVNLKIMHS